MIFQLGKRSMATSDAGRKRGVGANQSGIESTSSTQGGTRCPPSLGLIDSQSVEMAQKGTEFGVDGNKKVKGRKRHVMVDVLGLSGLVLRQRCQSCQCQSCPCHWGSSFGEQCSSGQGFS
jgi:hypothetical protein